MDKRRFVNPVWTANARPIAYVRLLELRVPSNYLSDELISTSDDAGMVDIITAFASSAQPGMPALFVLGFEAFPPSRGLVPEDRVPVELAYLSTQEFLDEASTESAVRVHTIHAQETIDRIPEWLGDHLEAKEPVAEAEVL